jgi:hypothetical protein
MLYLLLLFCIPVVYANNERLKRELDEIIEAHIEIFDRLWTGFEKTDNLEDKLDRLDFLYKSWCPSMSRRLDIFEIDFNQYKQSMKFMPWDNTDAHILDLHKLRGSTGCHNYVDDDHAHDVGVWKVIRDKSSLAASLLTTNFMRRGITRFERNPRTKMEVAKDELWTTVDKYIQYPRGGSSQCNEYEK